ncbi:MAG: hypothetical protein K5894_10875 [Lachnospiraceae bacterium]|nr:hypothetical protein [Lachnospiraceae bacterium]
MIRRLVKKTMLIITVTVIFSSSANFADGDGRLQKYNCFRANEVYGSELDNSYADSNADLTGTFVVDLGGGKSCQLSGSLYMTDIPAGMTVSARSENIAFLTGESSDIMIANLFMNMCKNSYSHNQNMLNPDYNYVSVGVFKSGGKYYAVEQFYRIASCS